MKAVLISIAPKCCVKIASEQKTVEVRKTKPKIETPFKCYIYKSFNFGKDENKNVICSGCGKVIGEFVCDKVGDFMEYCKGSYAIFQGVLKQSGLLQKEIEEYSINAKHLYLWHISDLKIYDKPKELGEFHKPFEYDEEGFLSCKTIISQRDIEEFGCEENCACNIKECSKLQKIYRKITRPPQSWCYVEELEI